MSNDVEGVEAYLRALPEPARKSLEELRAVLRKMMPDGTTEGISYGVPAFRYKGALLGYGAFTDHGSLFPMSPAVIEKFAKELEKFETSKGTIRFPFGKPPGAALLRKLVKARVEENESRGKKRKL